MEDPKITLDNNLAHLFRHASEITKETKGGYLNGLVSIPKVSKPQLLRVSLVPAITDPELNPLHLHPLLLHVNIRGNKKERQLQMKVYIAFLSPSFFES